MKTVQFFWNYFKVYKLSFVVVILMLVLSTLAQALGASSLSDEAVTSVADRSGIRLDVLPPFAGG